MAGYIGTQAVSVNTTSATISDDLAVGDDATVAGDATVTGVITGSTLEATGDTAAGDNAAMGYTSAEGLILTGQGSTNDVTIKNDADADVIEIPTGTVNVTMAGTLGVAGVVTANAGVVVDNITIDGQEIDVSSGDLTLDVAGDIYLNADGGQIYIKDRTTNIATFENSANALTLTDGNLIVAAGHGIVFGVDGTGDGADTSELLDDYEEGTWTADPTTGTCTSNVWYVKVGELVTAGGNIYGFSNRSSSAAVIIEGLPYAAGSGKSAVGGMMGAYIDDPSYAPYIGGGTSTILFYLNPSDAAFHTMKHADLNNSGADIHFTITYRTA